MRKGCPLHFLQHIAFNSLYGYKFSFSMSPCLRGRISLVSKLCVFIRRYLVNWASYLCASLGPALCLLPGNKPAFLLLRFCIPRNYQDHKSLFQFFVSSSSHVKALLLNVKHFTPPFSGCRLCFFQLCPALIMINYINWSTPGKFFL